MHRSHVVSLEARPPNVEGRGQVTVRELVRNALRMRPDRIVVGEVRGGEALDMLQAMNTGHDGSLSTAHANSCRHLLWRLETMAMMSDVELPATHVRHQVASAIDVVVQLARLRDGRRVVWEVASIEGTHRGEPVVSPCSGIEVVTTNGDSRRRAPSHGWSSSSSIAARTSATGSSPRDRTSDRLASTLLALAGVFAERAMSAARADRQRAALGIERPTRRFRPPSTLWFVIAGGVGALVAAGPVLAVAAVTAAAILRHVIARRRRASGRRRAGEQLADAVAAIAAGLRAGGSLVQAFAYARDEADEPLRSELSELVERIDLGTPVGEALSGWADVRDSEDVQLIAGVLDLHRRSGETCPPCSTASPPRCGNDERPSGRSVRSPPRRGCPARSSGLLPIAFFGFLILTSRAEMLRALASPLGSTALAVGLGMELLAFLWIRRLVEVR